MGGINHNPTNQVSLRLTVPAARALTKGLSEFMLGNVAIEDVILTPPDDFGVSYLRLLEAADRFDSAEQQLHIVREYVGRLLDTVARKDYEPFSPSTIDIDELLEGLRIAGLLPEDATVAKAGTIVERAGYDGMFLEIRERIDRTIDLVNELSSLTKEMAGGAEGKQGYFWLVVETNQKPWRQRFCRAHTAYTELVTFWSTTALICTEAHLKGIDAPSLLAGADRTV